MLRSIRLTTLLLLSTLMLACTGQNEKVALRYALEEGKTYKQEQTVEQEISYKMMGLPIDQNSKTITNLTHKVTDVQKNGNIVMDVTCARFRVTSEAMGQSQTYDSQEDTTRGSDLLAINPLGILVDQTLTTEMTPTGEVVKISGLKDITDAIFSDSLVQDDPTESAIKDAYGEKQMKRMFSQTSNIYPNDSVQVGDTWEVQTKVAQPMPMETKMTYTLKEIQDDAAVITLEGTLSSGEEGSSDIAGMNVDVKLEGEISGEMTVDRASGWIMQSSITQKVSGNMDISGIQTKMHIKTKTTIKGEK